MSRRRTEKGEENGPQGMEAAEASTGAAERAAEDTGWPEEVWATQLAGLLTGKAMAAYASLNTESAVSYKDVKKEVLHHYDVNKDPPAPISF